MPRKFDFLSPGIEIREVDQSILPAEVDADGPIIIGRFRKGPALKPVKVSSLEYFVDVFGNPVPGGSSLQGDIWRDGPNISAPTYAAYAAQSWLASGESPVTVVRLLGDQHPSATSAGYAGWQLSASVASSTKANNSTAYGLFVVDKSKAAQATAITLAAGTFNANTIGDGNGNGSNFKLRIIRGTVAASLHSQSTKATGMQLEIRFNDALEDKTSVTAAASGGGTDGSVPLITCGMVSSGGNINDVMAQLERALELAITNGYIDNIAIDNEGAVLKIYNLNSTAGEALVITDGAVGGHLAGSGIEADSSADPITSQEMDAGNVTKSPAAISATTAVGEGALAAIFYADSGYLALKGDIPGGLTGVTKAETLIKSATNALQYKLEIYSAADVLQETIEFNFDRTSPNYIRNKFSTNPQLVNSDMTIAADRKTYWLGETFERHLKTHVTSTAAGDQYAALLPLQKGTDATATGNWGYRRAASIEAKSGWLIAQDQGLFSAYNAANKQKLFRFCCLHAGEEVQKSIMLGIEELKMPTNASVYNYATFTVKVMDMNGLALEKYSGCNLDPNSPNFIARRIGDMYMEWNEADRRYRSYGNHPNVSDYVRIEMYDETADLKGLAPVGFFGPGRPKGFGAVLGDPEIKALDLSSDFTGSFSKGNGSVPVGASSEAVGLGDSEAAKFIWPSIPLRLNGSDGYSSNPYKVYWGIRPKIDANSSKHDEDYVDYVRGLPTEFSANNWAPSGDFEHSFVFSLDDVRVNESTNVLSWASGSRASQLSYTGGGSGGSGAEKNIQDLFDLGVKQFALPLFGGFDGLDITEKEPFRNAAIGSTLSETTNHLQYTLNKALDAVADEEVVPANLIAIPGIKQPLITSKMIRIAESRKDVLAVIDLENDYTSVYESTESASSRLGSVTSAITSLKNRTIDSSYACAFYPAVQIQDNLNNGERVWVPSSVAAVGAMAQSQARSELWFAPAGFNRGGLGNLGGRSGPRVIQARQRLDSSERDKLYEVNINPIATFPNEGVVIFGQKTLQQTPSALDRINVRRLMIFLKAEISKVARSILFDNNVPSTWARFTSQAEPILASVKSRFGLTDYRLVLDSSTTTADLIDRNIMYAKVFLKPARAIEYIAIDFVITRTGAEFA